MVAAACEKDLPVAQALGKTVAGVGPVVVREAVCRALGETPALACDLTVDEKAKLAAAIDELKAEHANGGTPTAVRLPQPDGVAEARWSSASLCRSSTAARRLLTQYPSYSELLEDYYATKDRARAPAPERAANCTRPCTTCTTVPSASRPPAARNWPDSSKADTLRLHGELLQANLWAVTQGRPPGDRAELLHRRGCHHHAGPASSVPNENAQKYFRDYKKKQTAHAMLQKLLVEGEAEIEYLAHGACTRWRRAPGEAGAERDPRRAEEPGLSESITSRGTASRSLRTSCGICPSDGFEILVGRNNLQNDKLTLHTARGKDLWFHVQKAPGSHCVVMSSGEDIPDTTKQEAAELAVAALEPERRREGRRGHHRGQRISGRPTGRNRAWCCTRSTRRST